MTIKQTIIAVAITMLISFGIGISLIFFSLSQNRSPKTTYVSVSTTSTSSITSLPTHNNANYTTATSSTVTSLPTHNNANYTTSTFSTITSLPTPKASVVESKKFEPFRIEFEYVHEYNNYYQGDVYIYNNTDYIISQIYLIIPYYYDFFWIVGNRRYLSEATGGSKYGLSIYEEEAEKREYKQYFLRKKFYIKIYESTEVGTENYRINAKDAYVVSFDAIVDGQKKRFKIDYENQKIVEDKEQN